ncbi:MAG: helix-turn-helix domain-containing protein [Syntrophomonadales bacterium]
MRPKLTEVATIVDILRLKQQGLSKNAVAKRLGISRDTVRKYWNCVQLLMSIKNQATCWSEIRPPG